MECLLVHCLFRLDQEKMVSYAVSLNSYLILSHSMNHFFCRSSADVTRNEGQFTYHCRDSSTRLAKCMLTGGCMTLNTEMCISPYSTLYGNG